MSFSDPILTAPTLRCRIVQSTRLRFWLAAVTVLSVAAAAGADDRTDQVKSGWGRTVENANLSMDVNAVQNDLQRLGRRFIARQTAHFCVLADVDEYSSADFLTAIEQTYRSCGRYARQLGVEVHPPDKKLIIFYFAGRDEFNTFVQTMGRGAVPANVPGLYFPDLKRGMFYNYRNDPSLKIARQQADDQIASLQAKLKRGRLMPAERKQISRQIADARARSNRSEVVGGDITETIVQHEVAHQVLWNIGFHNGHNYSANPRWFAEGTAMMFEPISDGASANFGAVNRNRLTGYRNAEQKDQLIPLRELITSPASFSGETQALAYAESWALVHYLNRAKRQQLQKYVEILKKRPSDYVSTPAQELVDFEVAFGKLDGNWERQWKQWMDRVQ